MTKEYALHLETNIENIIKSALFDAYDIGKVEISLSLSNKLKIVLDDTHKFWFKRDDLSLDMLTIEQMDWEEVVRVVNTLNQVLKLEHDNIQKLLWSYDNISKLI